MEVDSESDDEDIVCLAMCDAAIRVHDAVKRQFWIHPTLTLRPVHGEYHALIQELRSDPQRF